MIQLISSILFAANTICVPTDYSSIADAISHAEDGDTIVVADGVYEISAQLEVSKPITLKSANGAGATVIKRVGTSTAKSGTHIERVIAIDHAGAVVEGMTITGGRVCYGDKNDANRTLDGAGAGVFIGTNGGTLSSCIVSNNQQVLGISFGSGVASIGVSGVVTNCLITANILNHSGDTRGVGSGIFMKGGELVDSVISNNIGNSNYTSGSVTLEGAVNMRRCKVTGNTVLTAKSYDWGAYWCATPGVYVTGAGALVENCLIAGNIGNLGSSNGSYGGGFAADNVNCTVVNCTIVGNTAGNGGGVWVNNNKATFVNCIIQGNTADANAQVKGLAKVIAQNCICPDEFTAASSSGNILTPVVFKTDTYEPAAGASSYNAGTTSGCSWLENTVDLKRGNRIEYGIIDIGCYEYIASGYDVQIGSNPNETAVLAGTSVEYTATVFPEPDNAVYSWKIDGVEASAEKVFVKSYSVCGNYTVTLDVSVGGNAQPQKTTTMTVKPEAVWVVDAGEAPGHTPTFPYDTKANAFTTVIEAVEFAIDGMTVKVGDGDYSQDDQIDVEKAISLVSEHGVGSTILRRVGNTGAGVVRRVLSVNANRALISGFSIEGGYSTLESKDGWGSGIYLGASGGTISGCVIRNCSASAFQNMYGTGVCMLGGLVVNCVISNNTLAVSDQTYRHGGGAGVAMLGGRLSNCRVIGNRSNCRNTPTGLKQSGAGVLLRKGQVDGCLIAENESGYPAAGLSLDIDQGGGNVIVSNTTITANHSTTGVGGMITQSVGLNAGILVNNCIAGNSTDVNEGSVQIDNASSVPFTYCFGPEGELPAGEGNVFGTDAKFYRGTYRPRVSSPLCNVGVYADWMATATDLRGRPRATGRHTVDIGCYQANHDGFTVIFR